MRLGLWATYFAVFLCYSILYSPQPLLNMFIDVYGVTAANVSLIVTASFIPLFVAPLVYGYLLGRLNIKHIQSKVLILLSLLVAIFSISSYFPLVIILRFAEGFLLPIILTMSINYIYNNYDYDRQFYMSCYVTATIIGGFLGRFLAGAIATYSEWQYYFYGLSACLLICGLVIYYCNKEEVESNESVAVSLIDIWSNVKAGWPIYFSSFFLFAAFVSVLNVIPFRIVDIEPTSTEFTTAIMYSGYIMGIVTSLSSSWLLKRYGSSQLLIVAGYLVFFLSVILLYVDRLSILFLASFVFSGAMFFIHSLSSSVGMTPNKKLGNALYLCFYYLGGAFGSLVPPLLYHHFDWNTFLMSVLLMILLGTISCLLMRPKGQLFYRGEAK